MKFSEKIIYTEKYKKKKLSGLLHFSGYSKLDLASYGQFTTLVEFFGLVFFIF